MIHDVVTFTITNRCNISCSICCLKCNPANSGILDDFILEKTIHQLKYARQIRYIAISGGEPMLYMDKVFKISHWASEIGKQVILFTNGFWFDCTDKTRKVLVELKNMSLIKINTSVDAFHQEHIPISNIINLLSICKELGIEVNINSAVTNSTIEQTDELLKELGKHKLDATISQSPVAPIGMAKKINNKDIIRNVNCDVTKCSYDGVCDVDWNGNVYACCSQYLNKHLILGNIYDTDICSILKNATRKTDFFRIVKNGIYDLMSEEVDKGTYIPKDKYVSSCELCSEIFFTRQSKI